MKNLINKLRLKYFHANHSRFSDVEISNTTIRSQKIENSIFTGVRFDNVTFRRCAFNSTDFINCVFINCNFDYCTFNKILFDKVEIKNFTIRGSEFFNCKFINWSMIGGVLDGGKFTATNFNDFRFISVKVKYVTFESVCFTKCYMEQLDFVQSVVVFNCVFTDTNIFNCYLDGGTFYDNKGLYVSGRLYSTGRPVYAFMVDGEIKVKDGGFYGTLSELRERNLNTIGCIFHLALCDELIPEYFNEKQNKK